MTAEMLVLTAALLTIAVVAAAALPGRPWSTRVTATPSSPVHPDEASDRQRSPATRLLAAAATVVVVAAALGTPAAVAAALAVVTAPRRRRRRLARRRAATIENDLPEVVDLLALAVGAGLTVPNAVRAVAARAPGPLAAELATVVAETARGRRFADALDDLPGRTGEATRPLVATLAASERYGASVAEALDRLAVDARNDHRRRAEQAARRLPVLLLFPLVLCILPAFALLAVAPLVADAVQALRP